MNQHNLSRFHAKYRKNTVTECCDWIGRKNANGYGIFVTGHAKGTLAHRAIYDHVFGIPEGKSVLHSCDNPACVNIDHLRAGTQTDNMRDMINRNRGKPPALRGEANPAAKLTAFQVSEIRRRYKPRVVTLKMLSEEFLVCQAALSLIINFKRW